MSHENNEENEEQTPGDLVGVGLANLDYVALVPAWERDQKGNAEAFVSQVGGPVPVALAARARLSAPGPIHLIAAVGDDAAGQEVTNRLEASGVNTRHVRRAPGRATSRSLVLLDARDGSRTVANWPGDVPPLAPLSAVDEDLLAHARVVHLDGRDLPAGLRAAEIVRANGGLVSLDLGTMRPGRERLIAACDIVLASRKGGAGAVPAAATPEDQVRGLRALGVRRVAGVTLGAQGIVIGTPDMAAPVHLPAFVPPGPVVDTCGAGDCFHGAFLYAYLAGPATSGNALAAADFAQAAVALRVTRLGNDAGLPTRAQIEAFLAAVPGRC